MLVTTLGGERWRGRAEFTSRLKSKSPPRREGVACKRSETACFQTVVAFSCFSDWRRGSHELARGILSPRPSVGRARVKRPAQVKGRWVRVHCSWGPGAALCYKSTVQCTPTRQATVHRTSILNEQKVSGSPHHPTGKGMHLAQLYSIMMTVREDRYILTISEAAHTLLAFLAQPDGPSPHGSQPNTSSHL
jgi:hypothetical protein